MNKCLHVKTENGLEPTAQANNVATAIKLALLQEQANQGFSWNDEIWITESGDWVVPFTGHYGIWMIGGGDGASIAWASGGAGTCSHARAGDSGGVAAGLLFLEKDSVVPVTIGAGGLWCHGGHSDTGRHYGGITAFGEYLETDRGKINRALSDYLSTANMTRIKYPGGGIGGGPGEYQAYVNSSSYYMESNNGQWHGAGGGVGVSISNTTAITYVGIGSGHAGAVRLRFFNPTKAQLPTIDGEVLTPYSELLKRVDALEAQLNINS